MADQQAMNSQHPDRLKTGLLNQVVLCVAPVRYKGLQPSLFRFPLQKVGLEPPCNLMPWSLQLQAHVLEQAAFYFVELEPT